MGAFSQTCKSKSLRIQPSSYEHGSGVFERLLARAEASAAGAARMSSSESSDENTGDSSGRTCNVHLAEFERAVILDGMSVRVEFGMPVRVKPISAQKRLAPDVPPLVAAMQQRARKFVRRGRSSAYNGVCSNAKYQAVLYDAKNKERVEQLRMQFGMVKFENVEMEGVAVKNENMLKEECDIMNGEEERINVKMENEACSLEQQIFACKDELVLDEGTAYNYNLQSQFLQHQQQQQQQEQQLQQENLLLRPVIKPEPETLPMATVSAAFDAFPDESYVQPPLQPSPVLQSIATERADSSGASSGIVTRQQSLSTNARTSTTTTTLSTSDAESVSSSDASVIETCGTSFEEGYDPCGIVDEEDIDHLHFEPEPAGMHYAYDGVGRTPYICRLCGRRHESSKESRAHLRRDHGLFYGDIKFWHGGFQCGFANTSTCGRTFSSIRRLNVHVRKVHGVKTAVLGKELTSCKFCALKIVKRDKCKVSVMSHLQSHRWDGFLSAVNEERINQGKTPWTLGSLPYSKKDGKRGARRNAGTGVNDAGKLKKGAVIEGIG